MINFKKLCSLGLAATCAFSLAACGSEDEPAGYEPIPQEDDTIYSISICQDESNQRTDAITLGITDALIDLFGQSHLNLTIRTCDENTSAPDICNGFLQDGTDLIIASGDSSLMAASGASSDCPIIGVDVMDYEQVLHIITPQDKTWNSTTGTNVTGVSSQPSIADQLSLLIEAVPELNSVGLLYSPEDSDSIYQNEIMEQYLDEAGIPWKEYQIASTAYAGGPAAVDPQEVGNINIIVPSKFAAASAQEGPNMDVESFGESSLLSGINSPSSVRTARVSQRWTLDSDGYAPGADASTEELLQYACSQCSVLFIPSQSALGDQMETISSIATATGTVTVGGDASLGANTLVSTYADPFAQGYAAGKIAYDILIKGSDPGSIKINQAGSKNTKKLYNGNIAAAFGREFPKSFQEIHSYLDSYEIGSDTEREGSSAAE